MTTRQHRRIEIEEDSVPAQAAVVATPKSADQSRYEQDRVSRRTRDNRAVTTGEFKQMESSDVAIVNTPLLIAADRHGRGTEAEQARNRALAQSTNWNSVFRAVAKGDMPDNDVLIDLLKNLRDTLNREQGNEGLSRDGQSLVRHLGDVSISLQKLLETENSESQMQDFVKSVREYVTADKVE